MEFDHHVVQIQLIVKAEDQDQANDIAMLEISKWYTRDLNVNPPYPVGSLLHYSLIPKEQEPPPPSTMEEFMELFYGPGYILVPNTPN